MISEIVRDVTLLGKAPITAMLGGSKFVKKGYFKEHRDFNERVYAYKEFLRKNVLD